MLATHRWRSAWGCLVLALAATAGCKSSGDLPEDLQLDERVRSSQELPRIHSIGTGSVLVYETGHPLVIPVSGVYLANESLIWTVSVTGIAPLQRDRDFTVVQPDGFTALGVPPNGAASSPVRELLGLGDLDEPDVRRVA